MVNIEKKELLQVDTEGKILVDWDRLQQLTNEEFCKQVKDWFGINRCHTFKMKITDSNSVVRVYMNDHVSITILTFSNGDINVVHFLESELKDVLL